MRNATCPICGYGLDVMPGFEADDGRRFTYGACDNPTCPVGSIRIEWKAKR